MPPISFYLNYTAITRLAYTIVALIIVLYFGKTKNKTKYDWAIFGLFASQLVASLFNFTGALSLFYGYVLVAVI